TKERHFRHVAAAGQIIKTANACAESAQTSLALPPASGHIPRHADTIHDLEKRPMIRSLVFTTQGRLHSKDIEMFLMPTLLTYTNLFLWVDLENPTPEETKYVLEDVFHFHPLSIEDCVTVSPSPKVEEYSPKEEDRFWPYLFIVIHAVDYSRKDGVFATSELNFFL